MKKVIWHVGAWAGNYGDRVLQAANTQILKEHCSYDTEFVYINAQQTYFSDYLIDKMNKEADLLLIGGGGLLFHRPMDNSHSGWQFNIDSYNLERINIPIAVYGIGYNKFPYDGHKFAPEMWDNVLSLIEKSSIFSVRNKGTRDIVVDNGAPSEKINIVPDAGMFINADKFAHQGLDHSNLKIGFNWATDRPEQRFGSEKRALKAMKRTLKACSEIAQENHAIVYVIEHLMPNDLCSDSKKTLRKMAYDILEDRVVFTRDGLFDGLYPPFEYTAGFFAHIYKTMDLVIGMRGHAGIIPFGQNTPVIGIGAHNKVKWFFEDIGIPECFISLEGDNDFDRLIELSNNMLQNPGPHKARMLTSHRLLNNTKDIFMRSIVSLL